MEVKEKRPVVSRIGIARIFTIFFVCCFFSLNSFGTNISVWPHEIKFNFDGSSYSNDAITIRNASGGTATVPEWAYNNGSPVTEKFAYIMGQSNRSIQVRFNSNCSSMHLIINLTVTSGTGIGTVCNYFVANYTALDWITLTLSGNIPGSVGTRNFTWQWSVYAIPNDAAYCSATSTNNTSHSYYTLLAAPQAPMAEPWCNVLDYACQWANGSTTENQVCTNILSNGFDQHYTWNYQCHMLASDFVRLVSTLGINAYLHRWASKNPYYASVGQMVQQMTIVFDPVGPTHGNKAIPWSWHQWAEAASYQRDPSANKSVAGNWGAYEDYVFAQYEKVLPQSPYYQWDNNQVGQSAGCEAPENRDYYSYPGETWILTSWLGPSR
ncbi:MAG: hypothetical protein GXX78_15875 [Bacteroidales bacterium]|nr:hypothetical protein [Bacteroidales bacterium]